MPGERVQMPVTFFVDPEIVDDRDAKYTKVITLSYTFYEKEITLEPAKVSENAGSKLNQLPSEGKQKGA
jgi:cytochrome c oxidase assembly protein subunit 11